MRTMLFAALVVLGAGCASQPKPEPVTVEDTHRHDDYCGHYRKDGKWYFEADHVHGHLCGHSYRRGNWISRL